MGGSGCGGGARVPPPALEIAVLLGMRGAASAEQNRQWIRWKHVKVLLAIARCRTAALGGHFDECTRCAHRAPISYNSCRDRHCPKCRIAARERWIAARERELLPTRYLHVVFTLPRHLAPVVLQNKKVIYDLLFRASAETLLEVARDPRHLGAEIGFFSVLHTWNQKLTALSHDQFFRSFMLQLLPQGFVRIRHFGFLACRRGSTTLQLSLQLLGTAQEALSQENSPATEDARALYRCPKCGGPMKV